MLPFASSMQLTWLTYWLTDLLTYWPTDWFIDLLIYWLSWHGVTAIRTWAFVDLQITGVGISPGSDQLVIIHLQGGNDLVLCLQSVARSNSGSNDRVGELVGSLCRLWLAWVTSWYLIGLSLLLHNILDWILFIKQLATSISHVLSSIHCDACLDRYVTIIIIIITSPETQRKLTYALR